METKVTEKLISRIWQHKLVTEVATDNGEQIHIIHPGRSSNAPGCDFQDAVFTINGKMITGNIEVHVKSSQWQSHGHHRDPKYNSIALHVVWWHDSQAPTLLQNGQVVPTICLGFFINSTLEELNKGSSLSGDFLVSCPIFSSHSNMDNLSKILTAAGEERFATKTRSFHEALKEEDAGQALYRGIARALGYAQNAKPCEELSNKLPLTILEGFKSESDITRQALILGTAGLLPSQRHRSFEDREVDKLERTWRSLGITEAMNEADWCFFRVRPENFPTRRLIALSYLVSRHSKTELRQGIIQMVKKAPLGAEHRWLESGLTVSGRGYWRNHFDLGITQKKSSALLGREKTSAILINTVLPFTCAWGELNSDLKLKKKAADIYRRYPVTGENELTRYMKQQLMLNPQARLSACQQQGLIHIFKTCCRHRNCTECLIALNRC